MSRPFFNLKGMIRLQEIQNSLSSLVGWRQSYDPSKAIDRVLTDSDSGLYFQDAHPLVTLDSINSIIPQEWEMQYPEWNQILTYQKGQKVRHEGLLWIALRDNTGEEPKSADFNGDYSQDFDAGGTWQAYNMLSDYLKTLVNNGISTMVQTFVEQKQLNKETRNLLEHRTFFDGAGRLKATIQNRGNLVGFEIVPIRAMGVTAKINKVGLQMTGATGKIRLYLFHSSQIEPVKVYDLDFTATNGGFQWFDLQDCYLPYISDGNNAGGSWYLCYNQNDMPLGMEAINVSKDWSREPCGSCNMGSVEVWREMTKYLQVSPFCTSAPETFNEYPEMWDVADNIYTNTTSYGLNCEISIGCDLTDFIISQRQIFATVLQKQVAAIALRTLAMNPDVRVNRNQLNVTRMDVLYELDGNTSGIRANGLGAELKNAYKALNFDTQGLDRVCLKCNNRGVKYTTV